MQSEETTPHPLRPNAAGTEHEITAHEGEHGADAHGAAHEGHELAPINWVDFGNKEQLPYAAALFNFVILLAIYVKLGKKPLADALKKRKVDIAADIEEAAKVKREAEERAKKYQADLANLDQDLEVARQALVEAGKKERERIVAEAKERAVRMKRDAETLLGQEAKQKSQDLTIETIERATASAEQILKTKLTQEDHLRLAEEFLTELGQRATDLRIAGAA
jgi:F-type H+-transporting ATPase subunit b